jgi:acetyl esterase/lipase
MKMSTDRVDPELLDRLELIEQATGGEMNLDENIRYAHRLLAAGVPTELHVYPGAYHGFNRFAPSAAVSKRCNIEQDTVLKRFLHD